MICTISSRTSPRPPGNWCEARSVVGAARALALNAANMAAATAADLSGIMRFLLRKLAYSARDPAGLPADHLPWHQTPLLGPGLRRGSAPQPPTRRRKPHLLPRHPIARS